MNIQHYDPKAKNQTGIISGEPGDVYHANPAISNSDLKLFIDDPKRFEARIKGEWEDKGTKSKRLGDIFHVRCLESIDVFNGRFVLDSVVPQKPTKAQLEAHGKFCKEFKVDVIDGEVVYPEEFDKLTPHKTKEDAFLRQDKLIREYNTFWKVQEGREIVAFGEVETAINMRQALFDDPDTAKLLEGFKDMHKELTLRTEELLYGFQVQSKLDIYDPKTNTAIDLKTVNDLDKFQLNFYNFGYYRQAGFYSLVAELMFGKPLDHFYFIAVESEPPHEVCVVEVNADDLYLGLREIQCGLASLSKSLKSRDFSKRYPGIKTLSLEPWQRRKIEARLERLESGVAA